MTMNVDQREREYIHVEPFNGAVKNTQDDKFDYIKEEESVTLNPFVHQLSFNSAYDYFKLVFMSIFVLPIRVLMIMMCLVIGYVITKIGMYGLTREDLAAKPITGWRRVAKDQVCQWVRNLYIVFGFHYVQVKGRKAQSKEAPILAVAPHSSMFDALPVVAMGAPSIVAKGEVKEVPFFAKYIDFTQPVYVWREDTNSRQNTIMEIKRRVTSEYEWPQIIIFPEGTCTNRSCLITYKPGAFYPGVPVQPVIIRYPNKTDCITWTWDGPGAIKMLWTVLCQFHNFCELEYLPVYHPSPEEINDAHLYAHNVRQVMADALNIPVADYTYDDCRIMHQAKLKNLPCEIGLIEFQKLRRRFGNLSLQQVEGELLNQYAEMALTNGKISLRDMSTYLGIPFTEPSVVELFNLFDKNGHGVINFRDYLIYRDELLKKTINEETITTAFKLFDREDEGSITCEAFTKDLAESLSVTSDTALRIFKEMDTTSRGSLTIDDFRSYSARKPEYAKLFLIYQKSLKEGSRSKTISAISNGIYNKNKTE